MVAHLTHNQMCIVVGLFHKRIPHYQHPIRMSTMDTRIHHRHWLPVVLIIPNLAGIPQLLHRCPLQCMAATWLLDIHRHIQHRSSQVLAHRLTQPAGPFISRERHLLNLIGVIKEYQHCKHHHRVINIVCIL